MTAITVELNGVKVNDEVEPRQTLADFLRDRCGLTATHLGCEHGACGACTVVVDGIATRSCLTLAVMSDGRTVFTLEGLRSDGFVKGCERACPGHDLETNIIAPRAKSGVQTNGLINNSRSEDSVANLA